MRCEGMPKCVWGDAGGQRRLPRPEAEAAGDVGIREATAALGEEERPLAGIGEERPATLVEITPQRLLGRLADRQQPLLLALAEDTQLLGLEVHRALVEIDDLLAA